jgi:hypothetical protein
MSCLIEGDELCAEYIGLEYPVALDLHLYFYSFRDVPQPIPVTVLGCPLKAASSLSISAEVRCSLHR